MCNAQISPVSNRPYRDRFSVSIAESGRLGPRSVRGEESCSHIRALAAQEVGSRDVVACCRVLQSRIGDRAGACHGSGSAIVTAGARPNPNLSVAPGIPSPYPLTSDLAVPIETAGKRRHRVQVTRNLDRAARLDLADSACKIRSAVRIALLSYLVGVRNLELLCSEEEVRRRTGNAAGAKVLGWRNTQTGNRLGADRAFEDTPGNPYRRRSGERSSRCTGGRYRDSSGRVTGL